MIMISNNGQMEAMFSFFSNQRRASFVALGIGLIVIAVVLFIQKRRLFWKLMPPFLLLSVIYLGVFWNSGHPLAFGASSFRSVIGMGDDRDSQSNQYRDIENANIMFTIQLLSHGPPKKISQRKPLELASYRMCGPLRQRSSN